MLAERSTPICPQFKINVNRLTPVPDGLFPVRNSLRSVTAPATCLMVKGRFREAVKHHRAGPSCGQVASPPTLIVTSGLDCWS